MLLERFEIKKLHGTHNVNITIKDNILVLIAENGSGKSIILQFIYLFLSKQWAKLLEYEFESVNTVIDGRPYSFAKKSYDNISDKTTIQDLSLRYPLYRDFIINTLSTFDINELNLNSFAINEIEAEFDIPLSLLMRMVNELNDSEFDNSKFDWNLNVLFLPTYRRIEKNFSVLFGDMDRRFEQYIKILIPELKGKISAEKKENEQNYSPTETDMMNFFSEIWKARNQERWKKKNPLNSNIEILEFGMNDVTYKVKEYFKALPETHKSGDENFQKFLDCCNRYLNQEKILIFDTVSNSLVLKLNENAKLIQLESLSSGEKHLISLFCHLYLDEEKPFVIIDEPELSIAIRWQETLLSDILSSNCEGLIAATHSPFIISTNIQEYTSGLNEFFEE